MTNLAGPIYWRPRAQTGHDSRPAGTPLQPSASLATAPIRLIGG